MSGGRGIGAFLVERCLPVYPVLLTLWVFAAESITIVVSGSPAPWRPTWDTAVKVLALSAAGAFLRMVDDQKDLDYDRCHHPTRPLAQGRVSVGELRRAMVPAAAAAVALAAAVSAWSAALLAGALLYSVGLWWVETRVRVIGHNALANLAAVCPMQFLVTGFAMTGGPPVPAGCRWRLLAVPVIFTCALLHAEIARKTVRLSVAEAGVPDRHSYAHLLGPSASAALACGFGLAAVAAELLVSMPWSDPGGWWPVTWLPLATAALPLVSAWIFLRSDRDHPQVLPTVFVVAFFVSVIGQGLVV